MISQQIIITNSVYLNTSIYLYFEKYHTLKYFLQGE